jgi:anti-sigma factor RsiW
MSNAANQDDPILLVHAYLDGELDPAHALEVERRLAHEPALAAEHARIQALQHAIGALPREVLPPGLERRIETAVGLKAAAARPSWRALAASVVLAAVLGGTGTWLTLGLGARDPTPDMLVASHMRALMAPQPTDVSSSDRHTVKPWFNGRIPESPRVVDLTAEGFPMVGGRIDVVGRTPVPTLVYRHRQHLISLTALPTPGTARAAERRALAGYNILSWREDGVSYWAISDLGSADLDRFAKLFREASAQP